MNYPCANCKQNPVSDPTFYCNACNALYQPWACPCGAANQPGQPTCWQCAAGVQAPSQPAAGVHWQCACGYAFNDGPKCSNCKQAKPITPWKCEVCAYEYSLYDVCEKCKNPKGQRVYPPPQTARREPQKPWKCPSAQCAYEYNLEATCLKCKRAKPNPGANKPGCCAVF